MTEPRRAVYAAPVITLYQPPAVYGIPCLSPFGTKVETYLRMAGLPYRTRGGDPRRGPTGKIPYIELEGRFIGDSSDIVEALRTHHKLTFDDHLTASQRATGLVVKRTLEEHLYWVMVYARWVDPSGWQHTEAAFRKLLPRVIGPLLLHRVFRPKTKAALHAQGLGRHAAADIYRRGCEDVDAVAQLLGDQEHLLGERPTSVDCSLFALTSGVLMHPADNPIKQRMAGHANLVAYNDRMYRRYFGEHPPGSSKP